MADIQYNEEIILECDSLDKALSYVSENLFPTHKGISLIND